MTPKLEEQAMQQEQQLALLATIVFVTNPNRSNLREQWEHHVADSVEIAVLIQKTVGQHIAGE